MEFDINAFNGIVCNGCVHRHDRMHDEVCRTCAEHARVTGTVECPMFLPDEDYDGDVEEYDGPYGRIH